MNIKEEVSCGSKVSGIGGPDGGEGRPSRADHKGDPLAGQGHVSRPTSLALSRSTWPLMTACELGQGSSAAEAKAPLSCPPVCPVLPQHNAVAVLASPNQCTASLQTGISTVALTPITPTISHSHFVPSTYFLGTTPSYVPNQLVPAVATTIPDTFLTPTTLSPSTPNSTCASHDMIGFSSQASVSHGFASASFQQLEGSSLHQSQKSVGSPVSNLPKGDLINYFSSIPSSNIFPRPLRFPGNVDGNVPVESKYFLSHTCHSHVQPHTAFSANYTNANMNNILQQHNTVPAYNANHLRIVNYQRNTLLTPPVSNQLAIPFSPVTMARNISNPFTDSSQPFNIGVHSPSSNAIPIHSPNFSLSAQAVPSSVEQQPNTGEFFHLRSNSLPLCRQSSVENSDMAESTLPRSSSFPQPLPGPSGVQKFMKPIKIERRTGFFFQGELPELRSPTLSGDSVLSVERDESTRDVDVNLGLTWPLSPLPLNSDDESMYSYQGNETVLMRNTDSSEVSSEEFESEAEQSSRSYNEELERLLLPHLIRGSFEDGHASNVAEREDVYDEYEPTSDHDQNAPVEENSDSDIDVSFAVAAITSTVSDMEEFADQSEMESDGADTDKLDMAAFFVARKDAKRRNRMYNCDFSSPASESDHDCDDRWKCLECNQTNNRSFFRYCEKCWKTRRCWLPDPPKKRKKKKPRHRPRKRRSGDKPASAAAKQAGASGTEASSSAGQIKVLHGIESCRSTLASCSTDRGVISGAHAACSTDQGETAISDAHAACPTDQGETAISDAQQHNLTDAGADFDRCSTASGADSLPSVVDSGLGSSQDLYQETSQDVPAHLSADTNSYGSAIVFTSSRKRELPNEKFEDFKPQCRRRSSSAGGRIEMIDFVIEEVDDETSSQRGSKRKCLNLDSETSKNKKKKQNDSLHEPIAKFLNKGLSLIDETTDVQQLPESHNVRVISEAIVEFLRSGDGWEWMSSDSGRSWMCSAPVQSTLQESLRRSTDAPKASSSVFGDNLCIMCQDRPKDAVIIHGKISHQATCYQCAKTIFDRKQRCPVCRRKILRIAKNIIA